MRLSVVAMTSRRGFLASLVAALVRLLRSRKVPPDHLMLFGDGRVIASSGLSNEAIVRRMEEGRLFHHGRGWITVDQLNALRLTARDEIVRVANLFDS